MRHYLYRIYNYDGGEEEILVGADTIKEADWILSRDVTIMYFSYLDELTDQEAEDSGLDEL